MPLRWLFILVMILFAVVGVACCFGGFRVLLEFGLLGCHLVFLTCSGLVSWCSGLFASLYCFFLCVFSVCCYYFDTTWVLFNVCEVAL